jgi:hypothetical protein
MPPPCGCIINAAPAGGRRRLLMSSATSQSSKMALLTWGRVFLSPPRPPPLARPRMFPDIFLFPLLYPLVLEGQGVDHLACSCVVAVSVCDPSPREAYEGVLKPLFPTTGRAIRVHLGVVGDGRGMAGFIIRFPQCCAVGVTLQRTGNGEPAVALHLRWLSRQGGRGG